MKVVSNATAIIALAKICLLRLLKEIFGTVYVPPKVMNEILVPGKEGYEKIKSADFIKVVEIRDKNLVNAFTEIERGEAESIVLARELNADLVLLDEKDARLLAERLELKVLGTVGLLLLAKRMGYIDKIKPLISELIKKKFRISESVVKKAFDIGEGIAELQRIARAEQEMIMDTANKVIEWAEKKYGFIVKFNPREQILKVYGENEYDWLADIPLTTDDGKLRSIETIKRDIREVARWALPIEKLEKIERKPKKETGEEIEEITVEVPEKPKRKERPSVPAGTPMYKPISIDKSEAPNVVDIEKILNNYVTRVEIVYSSDGNQYRYYLNWPNVEAHRIVRLKESIGNFALAVENGKLILLHPIWVSEDE